MGYCKDCIYYGTVDDYYALSGGYLTGGCTLTGNPQGFYDSCGKFTPK